MFKYTTAIRKLRAMKARKKVIQGGTSSGKTYGIIPVIVDRLIKEPRLKATVVAESLPAVKEGALDIFKTIMYDTNRWIQEHWNASTLTYTFANGSRIQFKSFDSVGKAKASGKRDILFLNEANHIAFDIADALMIRSKETWIDFNPDNEFWVHKETLKEPNSEFCLINFEDNEALPPETLEDLLIKKDKAFYNTKLPYPEIYKQNNIKSKKWANWCKVYIYGQIGTLEGNIYSEWNLLDSVKFDDLPYPSYYGLDFGATNPTALVEVKFDGQNTFYVKELLYQPLNNLGTELWVVLEKLIPNKSIPIVCDYADPNAITDLRIHGFNAIPCTPKNVKNGIIFMQSKEFYLDPESKNLIEEYQNYKWEIVNEINLDRPLKKDDHLMDATRYICEYLKIYLHIK